MENKLPNIFEYYRKLRPEKFSDSSVEYEMALPRELLDYQLLTISTKMKQDQFETLCRRLAEKTITPNLIPQTGPTGGGDGKTDFETYPVADNISIHWYIPEGGCKGENKWAFAISSKADWSSKINSDVKHIVETKRGYTRVYFITNQTPSSKKRKDKEDTLKKQYGVDIVILDRNWILETIYNHDYLDIAIESLGLTLDYKKKSNKLGPNDTAKLQELEALERKISEWKDLDVIDTQCVDSLLQAAILSRYLEKPKDETIGRFDRALRICKKNGTSQQRFNIEYEKAYTCFYWYKDPYKTLEGYHSIKLMLEDNINTVKIEKFFTIFNLMYTSFLSGYIKKDDFRITTEIKYICKFHDKLNHNLNKQSSALYTRTFILQYKLLYRLHHNLNVDKIINEYNDIITEATNHLDIPFEILYKFVTTIGELIDNNECFDNLIDNIATISAKRNSELSSAEVYYTRGIQNLSKENYEDAIKYLGFCINDLSKNESIELMKKAYWGLGLSYGHLDLLYSSNVCFSQVIALFIRDYYQQGHISNYLLYGLLELCENEIRLGRIPMFLCWFELLNVLVSNTREGIDSNFSEKLNYLDCLLAGRLAYTDNKIDEYSSLPDILNQFDLKISRNTTLKLLGYDEEMDKEFSQIISDNCTNWIEMIKSQPLNEQLLSDTELFQREQISLSTIILGCTFKITFKNSSNNFVVAESILAFLESLLATSKKHITPTTPTICIEIKYIEHGISEFIEGINSSSYIFKIHEESFNDTELWRCLIYFLAMLLGKNFFAEVEITKYLSKLQEKERVLERLTFIMRYKGSMNEVLGNHFKSNTNNWFKESYKNYLPKTSALCSKSKIGRNGCQAESFIVSVIEHDLWDNAKWHGTGLIFDQKNNVMTFILAFQHIKYAKKIFEEWNRRQLQKDLPIRIAIIKGINKNHPMWYKVHITTDYNLVETTLAEKSRYMKTVSRFHLMTPSSSTNINYIISYYNYYKTIKLMPAYIDDRDQIHYDNTLSSIEMNNLIIREAWEIGEHDIDCVVIQPDDDPIIPSDVEAPILTLLKKKRN